MEFERNPVLGNIKEVKFTSDVDEIMALFATKKWVMIEASKKDGKLNALMGRYRQ